MKVLFIDFNTWPSDPAAVREVPPPATPKAVYDGSAEAPPDTKGSPEVPGATTVMALPDPLTTTPWLLAV